MSDVLAAIEAKKAAAIAVIREKGAELQELHARARVLAVEIQEQQTKVKIYVELEREIMGGTDAADAGRITLADRAGGGAQGLHTD